MHTLHRVARFALVACGIWLIGLGFYFMLVRPSLLPEDLRFIGASVVEIRSTVPGLERWLNHVFRVMGGFMAGAGVLTTYVATTAARPPERRASIVLAATGIATVGMMSLVNFQLDSDFKWMLLVPVILWCIGLVVPASIRSSDA